MQTAVLLVGCGRMGSALLESWKKRDGLSISVLDPSSDFFKSPQGLPVKSFDIIILAVKPQVMDEVCLDLKRAVIDSSLYVSIAAGKPLTFFEDYFKDKPVIRMMPNTPAMIGKGMTIGIGNHKVSENQKLIAESLFSDLGDFSWIETEDLMDAVTAISGSGPAYLFLLIEELAKAGIAQGLPEDLSLRLARQTVIGSSLLAESLPETNAAELRRNVTSPGGTTEAALEILMSEKGLGDLLTRAVDAAAARSRQLS